ncbi:MAG: DNA2/NAM7 family helicase [Muribaculaceae bacterium]|nr:DNA2/NAM7 family helicase [Muribaculaceae bacterium]
MARIEPVYQRVVVSDVSQAGIAATCHDGKESFFIPIDSQTGSELESILPYVKVGTQLNIVNPRTNHKGECVPEFIIYEPDYLIDITGVAECFETYCTSERVSLVKRLKPEVVTRHILLGGFAGMLLDEAVRNDGEVKLDYNSLANGFFRSNAVRIAVCDDIDGEFHKNVRRQQKNIEKAVGVSLRNMPEYEADKIILEPSFFCEMLGLQGRMDLLQTDFALLVEQKSGKGDYGSSEFGRPVHREPHLVQLLLYRALLRYGFNIPENEINSFLLYSKYPEPLIREETCPDLLRKAIEIRNLLVCQEMEIAGGDGLRRLSTLSPEQFHGRNMSPRFWHDYVLPDLEKTLSPLTSADALSKEYALRLLKFVALEQYYSKVGCDSGVIADGFAAAWRNSLEEKVNSGNIIHGLLIAGIIEDEYGAISGVILSKQEDQEGEMPNFRVGDIVVLYPYHRKEQPDLRRDIVIRCSISGIRSDSITLTLRAPQTNRSFFAKRPGRRWAIEHDVMDSSFKSLWRNVSTFLSSPSPRRELILGTREPNTDITRRRSGDYSNFNSLVDGAVKSEELFIIIGPPGTGKTSHGLMNILTEELRQPDSSVLLGAYTNRAVDEICGKLTEAGIDFIRMGTSLGCSEQFAENMIGARVDKCENIRQVRSLLKETSVIVGTIQSLTANISMFRLRGFSLAIIDEASQILEPQILGLLSATHDNVPAIKKFILIGDHKQLPAVVKQSVAESEVVEPGLRDIALTDCRRSFFERYLDLVRKRHHGTLPPQYVFTLSDQGRMHTEVADIASSFFYENKLGVIPLPHQESEIHQVSVDGSFGSALNLCRNIFVDVRSEYPVSNDNSNRMEAEVIAELVHSIYLREGENFSSEKSVGVIVPYRNQIAAVRKYIASIDIPALNNISVDTVERFQGSQREYIIYGFTIKRPDQFAFMTSTRFMENGAIIDRKLNVALTRARSHNILVGDISLLERDPLYKKLIQAFQRKGTVITKHRSLPELPGSQGF